VNAGFIVPTESKEAVMAQWEETFLLIKMEFQRILEARTLFRFINFNE
jgi:hypothetical protein